MIKAFQWEKSSREICNCCWHVTTVGFAVPDEIWEAAVHPQLQGGTLCLACFTRLADERLIDWAADIEFHPVSAAEMLDWSRKQDEIERKAAYRASGDPTG